MTIGQPDRELDERFGFAAVMAALLAIIILSTAGLHGFGRTQTAATAYGLAGDIGIQRIPVALQTMERAPWQGLYMGSFDATNNSVVASIRKKVGRRAT